MEKGLALAIALALPISIMAQGQKMPPLPPVSAPAVAPSPAPTAPTRISMDEAIRLALQHNHALQATRTTILQNQAEEVTANLRPNPTLSWDSQFFPLFDPSAFSTNYISESGAVRRRHRVHCSSAARSGSTGYRRQKIKPR